MPVVQYRLKGNLKAPIKTLEKLKTINFTLILQDAGKKGVEALRRMTPKDTGLTADSWSYEITTAPDSITLTWKNSSTNKSIPIALLLQFGHGIRKNGYYEGVDYINPALRPVFEEIEKRVWMEVNGK